MKFSLGSFLLLSSGLLGVAGVLVVKCPKPGSREASYCWCSNITIVIKCDFRKKEDVLLTKDLLAPYDQVKTSTAYIQMVNATTVNVSSDFIDRWHNMSSVAFDIWHSGVVNFDPSPIGTSNKTNNTEPFAGIGIIDCYVPEVPPGLLRDRTRGALRIKDSKVGVIRAGFFNNVKEIRYIVLEDSVVKEIEGSVTAEGYVTMSQLDIHTWNGLVLSNVTIHNVGPSAFNLKHKSDMEVLSVKNSQMGHVASGAFAAEGDFHVTIQGNMFQYLAREAFKVNVTGFVNFTGNQMRVDGLDALAALRCHNSSSLQNNTILVSDPLRLNRNQSSAPVNPSCGKPQLFMVLSPLVEVVVVEDTRAAWVLGAALAVLIMSFAVGVAWALRRRRPVISRGRFPILHKRQIHTASLENLPRNMELSTPREDLEEGTSVKDLDLTIESQQDTESPHFYADGEAEAAAAQSDSSCDGGSP